MSEWIPDTPALGVRYCPGCETARDPTREILETAWCYQHAPKLAGDADSAVVSDGPMLSGTGEAQAHESQLVARMIL